MEGVLLLLTNFLRIALLNEKRNFRTLPQSLRASSLPEGALEGVQLASTFGGGGPLAVEGVYSPRVTRSDI